MKSLNQHYGDRRPQDSEIAARLESFELAYRMQAAAPEAVDLTKESEAMLFVSETTCDLPRMVAEITPSGIENMIDSSRPNAES